MSSCSLIFFSAMRNVLLITSSVLFILEIVLFTYGSSLWVIFRSSMSLLIMFMVVFTLLSIWGIFIAIVLMSLFVNSIISGSARSVSVNPV